MNREDQLAEKRQIKWGTTFMKAALFTGLMVYCFKGGQTGYAAEQGVLENQVLEQTEEKILKTYVADYDGDGRKEAFIITGEEGENQTLWFSGEEEVKKLAVSNFDLNNGQICKVSKTQKLFVAEGWNGGSGSWSYCLYVKDGRCCPVRESGEGLTHISGKDFMIFPSSWDACKTDGLMTGHTWKKYYVKWNGKKFVNYKGTKISTSRLKKYEGAEKYLNKISKTGYKVGKIFYRKNGIININLYKKTSHSINYENVTLQKKGKKVVLVTYIKNGNDIIAKSSYGGIYRAEVTLGSPEYL